MQTLVIIGAGNVATHLYRAFRDSVDAEVIQIYNRSPDPLADFSDEVAITTDLSALKTADIYIVSISDNAIVSMVGQLTNARALVVHTSGSVPLLSAARRNGVFYPLQTFSKQTTVDFQQVPLCIEAKNDTDLKKLKKLGRAINSKVFVLNSEQRKSIHVAAVFACNFTNHLYAMAEMLCQKNDIPFETLHALISETAKKACLNSPKDVQTGPAVRRDSETIAKHLEQLDSPDLKEIYTLLTESIQSKNGSEL